MHLQSSGSVVRLYISVNSKKKKLKPQGFRAVIVKWDLKLRSYTSISIQHPIDFANYTWREDSGYHVYVASFSTFTLLSSDFPFYTNIYFILQPLKSKLTLSIHVVLYASGAFVCTRAKTSCYNVITTHLVRQSFKRVYIEV